MVHLYCVMQTRLLLHKMEIVFSVSDLTKKSVIIALYEYIIFTTSDNRDFMSFFLKLWIYELLTQF